MPHQLDLVPFADLWHPWVLAWIILVQVGYLLVVGPMRAGYEWGRPVSVSTKVCFSLGLWLIYLSEGTPLHLLAEHYLFSAHMVQHIVLTMMMAPLILLGTPDWLIRPLFKWRPIAASWRALVHPVVALLIFNLVYSLWHFPLAYETPLMHHWFHMVQHGILVFTALCMWWPICSPLVEFPRMVPGVQMLYLFVMGVMQIAVFAMITFSDTVFYQFYANAPRIWNITPLWDQEIAGAVMKVGGMGVMIVAWSVIFFRWVAAEERRPKLKDASSKA
jgi:putative membrane protein